MSAIDPAAPARLRRLGGERLLRELIELFLQLGPGRLAAAGGEDLEAAERACHSLKSAAGNLGAGALQQAAQRAEQAAEKRDAAALRAAAASLRETYAAAEIELRQTLTELDS